MSKRTNKTDHVLNLLSSGVKKKEEEPETPVKGDSSKETPSKVSIVRDSGAQVAETIREHLEEELHHAWEEEEQAAAVINAEAEEQPKEEELLEREIQKEETREEARLQKEETKGGAASKEEDQEDDFVMVNVMERLVRQRAPEYIKQFHICGCRRCLADVTALALTGLPAKYVVINQNAISPLMNFYTMKYAGRVTVEVTKACIAVQAAPHHKKAKAE